MTESVQEPARRRRWPRRLLGIALGVALPFVLVAVAYQVAQVRATQLVRRLLLEWATGEVAERSEGSYRLRFGELRFNWPMRRISLDAISLTTDSVRNAGRREPLVNLHIRLENCTLGGVDPIRLIRRRGFAATVLGCRMVRVRGVAPPPQADTTPKPRQRQAAPPARQQLPKPAQGFLVLQQGLRLPDFAPSIQIRRITFPDLQLQLTALQRDGDAFTFGLDHAEFRVQDVHVDPTDTIAARLPLFSRNVLLRAERFQLSPDTAREVSVGLLDASLTDSTVLIEDVTVGPTVSDAAFAQRSPYRRDRIRLSLRRLRVSGADVGAFARSAAIGARKIEIDTLSFEIRSDKRRPPNPVRRPKRYLQQFMAYRPRAWGVDSIIIRDGRVVYEEHHKDRPQAGRLTIDRLNAVGTSLLHVPGRVSLDDPFRLHVEGRLMGAASVTMDFTVPLDAPDFRMQYRGRLGSMRADAMNPFVQWILPARIKSGTVQSVAFAVNVQRGRASGTVTPLFTDLGVDITGEGMGGALGGGGIIHGAIRGIAEAAAGFKVRSNNPDRPDRPPRVGPVQHEWTPQQSIISFVVKTLLSGFKPVVVK